MSDPKNTFSGAIEISQLSNIGMVTIRADISDKNVVMSIEKATGLAVPKTRKIMGDVNNGLAWMSPDELLLFCESPTEMVVALTKALTGHSMVVDVSHARACFTLHGKGSREVLAKGAPVDLSPDAFQPTDFRRTRLGQVAVALWMEGGNPDHFGLVCFASVQDFVFDWLKTAAARDTLPQYFS